MFFANTCIFNSKQIYDFYVNNRHFDLLYSFVSTVTSDMGCTLRSNLDRFYTVENF